MTGPELAEAVVRIANGETVVAGEPGSKSRKKASAVWPGQEQGLTARQSEILALLAEGLTAAAVGEALFLSENTVKTHIAQILRRLGASNRAQAIAKAASLGLLDRNKLSTALRVQRRRPRPSSTAASCAYDSVCFALSRGSHGDLVDLVQQLTAMPLAWLHRPVAHRLRASPVVDVAAS